MEQHKNIPFAIEGYKGSSSRTPKEANEGIKYGTGLVLSTTQIEILDLLGEGEIEGLVTGQYFYSGTVGNVGWDRADFTANTSAQGSELKWLQSVYWNDVPLVSKNGQYNFQQINIQQTKGIPNGSSVSDQIVDEIKFTRNIQERLRGGGDEFAKIYRIINKYCKAVEVNVRIDLLSKTNPKNADTEVSDINWAFFYKPIFNNTSDNEYKFGKSESVEGKLSAPYVRSTRVELQDNSENPNFIGWDIKVVRYTEDSTTSTLRNKTTIDSLTEIYGDKLVYPNSAIVASVFDAEYFSSLPERLYLTDLLKVNIPNNYNPIKKTYGDSRLSTTEGNQGEDYWDGNFLESKKWTDNPAWCFYDLLTNKRYGLGDYLPESYVDKFTLYEISKYCDTLVPDGYGGIEPRFTCNLYITSREEAYKVVNEMASIFRAITYYSAGSIYTSQDSEKDPIWQFTNANVENGDFTYSSSAKKARHTVATVRYNDKNNLYKPAIEYVEDIDGIRQYGIREIEIPALGCTSRGQAMRMGRWGLLTERLETESVSFTAGIEAALIKPGDIVQIYDQYKHGERLGGRISNIVCNPSTTDITLDNLVTIQNNTDYKLSILTPSFFYEPSLITDLVPTDVTGIHRAHLQTLTFTSSNLSTIDNKSRLVINQGLNVTDYNVSGNNVWTIEPYNSTLTNIPSGRLEKYRVINIIEAEQNKYGVEAIEYQQDKFRMIDSGFNFESTATTSYITPSAPTDLSLSIESLTQNSKAIRYSFSTPNTANTNGWKVFVKSSDFVAGDVNSDTYLAEVLPLATNNGLYLPSTDGTYYFRVYGTNNYNVLSDSYAAGSISVTNINSVKDVLISSLRLRDDDVSELEGYNAPGTTLAGEYDIASPEFVWQAGLNGVNNLSADLIYRITVRAPSTNNIPSKEIYFEEAEYKTSVSNLAYIFDFQDNYNAVSNIGNRGPFRKFDIVVEARDANGNSSAGGNFITDAAKDALYDGYQNGYDIFQADNTRPSTRCLTDTENPFACPTSSYTTKQSLTADGDVKIYFYKDGNIVTLDEWFDDDLAGITFYYSQSPFTHADILNGNSSISTFDITNKNNPTVVPLGLTDVTVLYIAIAPYDAFDEAYVTYISNYLTSKLNPSNIVKLTNTASVNGYRAWIDMRLKRSEIRAVETIDSVKFNFEDSVAADFVYQEIGNEGIFGNDFKMTLRFSNYLVNNKYSIVINGVPFYNTDYIKTNDSFEIPITVPFTTNGHYFIGVLAEQ